MDKGFKNIIMGLSKWLKKKATHISLALGGVEKNAFSQSGTKLETLVGEERRHTQGTLMDSLKHGEVTQEVMNFRWRIYKILKATEGLNTEIIGYTEDNMPITKTQKKDKKYGLRKIKVDEYDAYPLELVLDNSEIVIGTNDAMYNDSLSILDKPKINYDESGNTISATHGEITSEEYAATNKQELPLKVYRDTIPKFEIETYTKKLNVRSINEKDKLLEFYVSTYPDEYNRRSRLFISDVKKAIENPRVSSMLDIKMVNFVTYKTIGVDDFLEYQYKIKSFDKIIIFNGYYVIKFIAEVVINGKDIVDEYRMPELDDKYNRKEKKNKK